MTDFTDRIEDENETALDRASTRAESFIDRKEERSFETPLGDTPVGNHSFYGPGQGLDNGITVNRAKSEEESELYTQVYSIIRQTFEELFWEKMPPELANLCWNHMGQNPPPRRGYVASAKDNTTAWAPGGGTGGTWSGCVWRKGVETNETIDNITGLYLWISLLGEANKYSDSAPAGSDINDYEAFRVADYKNGTSGLDGYKLSTRTSGDIHVSFD